MPRDDNVVISNGRLFHHLIDEKRNYIFFMSIQSEAEPKPIVTRSHSISRALRRLHVITLIGSLDCLRPLWLASDNSGFGFYDTQLISTLNSSELSFLTGWDNSCETD